MVQGLRLRMEVACTLGDGSGVCHLDKGHVREAILGNFEHLGAQVDPDNVLLKDSSVFQA
jgi:hypothetical protein